MCSDFLEQMVQHQILQNSVEDMPVATSRIPIVLILYGMASIQMELLGASSPYSHSQRYMNELCRSMVRRNESAPSCTNETRSKPMPLKRVLSDSRAHRAAQDLSPISPSLASPPILPSSSTEATQPVRSHSSLSKMVSSGDVSSRARV